LKKILQSKHSKVVDFLNTSF